MNDFKKISYVGIAIIVLNLIMTIIFKITAGSFFTHNPIIELEFVKSTDDVISLLTQDGKFFTKLIDAIDYFNIIDFLYAAVYSGFLLLFFSRIQKITKDNFFYIPMLLAIIAFAGDILENIQLFNITDRLVTYDFQDSINLMQIFTWTKWLSLTFIMLFHY